MFKLQVARAAMAAVILCVAPVLTRAEVEKVNIGQRMPLAKGQAFGNTGAYEQLTGTIEFALDPKAKENRGIVDLDKAAKGPDGRVHFTSDIVIMRPVDEARGNGVLLFEIVNRGRLGLLNRFSPPAVDAPRTTPAPGEVEVGDGYLLRQGYTLVSIGWEFDLNPGNGILRINAPEAKGVTEKITTSILLDKRADTAELEDAPMYRPVDPNARDSVLIVRTHFWDPPETIARDKWKFVLEEGKAPSIALDGGFEAGRRYDVTFNASGARVAGTGLAAIRDAAIAFRTRSDLPAHGNSAYAFGFSQTGRFLRQFLYDGFNVDAQGKRVFDAVWSHIAASSRGTFNTRFGTPTAGGMLVTPAEFPFTTEPETLDGQRDSILRAYKPEQRPKLFLSNTAVEYWGGGRAAALIHVSPDGKRDLPVPDDVRIYLLASAQHIEPRFPPPLARGQQMENPVPQREVMRALLQGLHEWAAKGAAPPASQYPTLADGTLVPSKDVKFPKIPGVADPRTIPGPGMVKNGKARMLPHLVPQVDADGNDVAGIRAPDVEVPVATNTGWNFRSPNVGNPTDIYNLLGSYIPFAFTEADRAAKQDPRPSVQARYSSKEDYLGKLRASAERLVKSRYLLEEDIPRVIARGEAQWDLVSGTKKP